MRLELLAWQEWTRYFLPSGPWSLDLSGAGILVYPALHAPECVAGVNRNTQNVRPFQSLFQSRPGFFPLEQLGEVESYLFTRLLVEETV